MRNPARYKIAALFGLCMLLAACEPHIPPWNEGKLIVAVPEDAQVPEAEFERELARMFAEKLNLDLQPLPLPQDEILIVLRKHLVHLAAAPLRSRDNISGVRFGPSYQTAHELVICNSDEKHPIKGFADLADKELAVVAGSAHELALREAKKSVPNLHWQAETDLTTQDLLAEVGEGTLDCAVANDMQFADARNYHHNLVAVLDVAPPSKLSWGFPENADPALIDAAQKFFDAIELDGTLSHMLDRYYGHSNMLNKMDATAFISNISSTLPRYKRMFQDAAAQTNEDWRMLAALAYQESQWNPLATSYTNVRGMMMLTGDTADQLQVTNRLDAGESILAGAHYLAMLKDKLPDRIAEPDRTWLALAAYNQGYSHVEDARILTQRAGQNPDSWADVKKWMLQLNRAVYYKTLKHGYARGGEAVVLVENTRNYYAILKRMEPIESEMPPEETTYRLVPPTQRLLP